MILWHMLEIHTVMDTHRNYISVCTKVKPKSDFHIAGQPMESHPEYSLHLPQNLHAFALVPCGYPAEERAQEDRFDVNRVHYIG